MSKNMKKIIIGIIFILALLYLAGVFYFSSYTYPNTKINEKSKGLILKTDAFFPDEKYEKLTIKGRDDKKLEINTNEIDLTTKIEGKPEIIQNQWIWPVEIFLKHDYEVKYSNHINDEKLKQIVEDSELFKNVKEPKDAYIEYENDKFVIKDEILGDKLDKDKFNKSLKEALSEQKSELVLKDEYINPKITKDDANLKKEHEQFAKLQGKSYIFDFEDRKWELKGKELLSMFLNKNGKLVLDNEKLYDYVLEIADQTNTYARKHKFNATGIGEITVPGGIYGWQMDIEGTTDKVKSMIEKGETGKVDILYHRTANHRGIDDIGNTYIEIDLSRQRMWLYVDGEVLVETDIISGDARSYKATTPTGVNMVWSKERKVKLKGNNAVYGTPYNYPVEYWMPVGWTNSGIHDTYHRYDYGGDVYKYNGSSSCINTPPAAMKIIYENTPYNTPVVIYESSTNYSPTEFEKQEMIKRGEAE